MDTVFSITALPMPSLSFSLKEIWIINADSSYDVQKNRPYGKELIALRTTKGEGIIEIGDAGSFYLNENSLFITQHHKVKRYLCADDLWSFYWFEFFSPPDIHLPLNTILYSKIFENDSLLASECQRMLGHEEPAASLVSSSIFSTLLSTWMRDHNVNTKEKTPHERILRNTAGYIRNNLDKKLSVAALAKQSGLCERRFRDLFARLYELPPKKYIDSYRIKTAVALLMNTPLSIDEISEQLRYSSQFHFTREFKKVIGFAPSFYRNKNADL